MFCFVCSRDVGPTPRSSFLDIRSESAELILVKQLLQPIRQALVHTSQTPKLQRSSVPIVRKIRIVTARSKRAYPTMLMWSATYRHEGISWSWVPRRSRALRMSRRTPEAYCSAEETQMTLLESTQKRFQTNPESPHNVA